MSGSCDGTPADVQAHERVPVPSPRSALLWSYALTIGRIGITGLVTVVIASFLDPRAYGVMALAMVWVAFAQALALHGPAQAVIQRDEVGDSHFDAAFWTTMIGSVALALLYAAAAPLWASVNDVSGLVYVCWALAPAIVCNGLVAVPDALLRRQLRFRALSIRTLVAGIVSGAAGIAAAVAGFGVWALVVQQITQTTLNALAVWAAVTWRPRMRQFRPALRDLRSYSLHSASGFLANFVSTRTDALMLGAFFGPVAIGLYRFVVGITGMVSEFAVGGLGQVSLPHLSRFSSDRAAFAERLGRVIHAGTLVAFPAFGVLAPAAPWLLMWIGPQWVDATPALLVLCAGGAIGSLGAILGAALQAAGRPGIVAAIGWGMATATVLIMCLVGVRLSSADPQTQVVAIAVVFNAIHAVAVVVCLLVMFRGILRVPVIPALRPAIPAMCACVAAVLSGWGVQPLLVDAPPFGGLVVSATVATICAGVVLIMADAEVSSYCRRVVRSGPARRALAALHVRRQGRVL